MSLQNGIQYADIDALQFGLLTEDVIEEWNIPEVENCITKRNQQQVGSINCASNGPSNANSLCTTCGNEFEHCQGHVRKITLFAPVNHVDFLQLLLKTFPTICIRCMRVLAPTYMLTKLNQTRVASDDAFRKCIGDLFKLCSKFNRVCWFPNDEGEKKRQTQEQPQSKRKAAAETNTGDKKEQQEEEEEETPRLLSMEEAQERGYCGASQPDFWTLYERSMIRPAWYLRNEYEYNDLPRITPEKLHGMLKFIQTELVKLYGFNAEHSPLHGMMISTLIVPPPLMRLPRGKPDELTITLNNIYSYNQVLKKNNSHDLNLTLGFVISSTMAELPTTMLSAKAREEMSMVQGEMSTKVIRKQGGGSVISKNLEDYFMLHREIAIYFDSKYNVPLSTEFGRNPVCLRKRFAAKNDDHGLVRKHILGKPSDYCARGVASCDTNQDIDQFGIPLRVAMHVTIPEVITPFNFNKMLLLAMNGKTHYPGCNFIRDEEMSCAPDANMNGLPLGKILDRHLQDDDPVIFNRAPSLHRFAIMGARALIHKQSTMKSVLAVCRVLNLDFDGDDLNTNVPQTEEQKAEVRYLITVLKNLICDSELVIGCVQHSAIGAERATNEEYGCFLFSPSEIQQMLVSGNNAKCRKDFEAKWTRFNQRKELTGRQFMKLALPTYDGTYILTKRTLNACIRDTIHHMDDMPAAGGLIGFLTRICEHISDLSGTSILMDDLLCDTPATAQQKADTIIKQAHRFALQQQKQDSNDMNALAETTSTVPSYLSILGMSKADMQHNREDEKKGERKQTTILDPIELEDDLCETLSRYRDVLGKPLLEHLKQKPHGSSGIHTIVSSGAKGDVTAIVQNIKVVGQQNTGSSSRYRDTTSHYFRDECSKYGFVKHALLDSLTPTEYFFLLRSGRDGLINTSCKTADIGYVYRKIFKSLEDLRISYGSTVRNANGQIILFSYGFDTTFLRSHKLESILLNIADCVANFATDNDAMSVLEVEHLLELRERVVLAHSPPTSALFPFQFDRVCSSVFCINKQKKCNNNIDPATTTTTTTTTTSKKTHRCVAIGLNAVRNRICKMWNSMVVEGHIPCTPQHELCFFEQLSTRKLRDRGYLDCVSTLDAYLNHVERMFFANMCIMSDACGMKCSQDTTQPGTQAGLSLFRIAGEKTTVLQGTERFKEIINLPKVMHQPMMYIYLEPAIECEFDPMSLIELRLVYIVTHFDDSLPLGAWETHLAKLPSDHALHKGDTTKQQIVHLSMYLDKDAMHRRQLSPRIIMQYLRHVRVLLYDMEHVGLTHAELTDDKWWVTVSIPTTSSIWKAVAPEEAMHNDERSSLLMYTLKADKMLLAGYEGIRDYRIIEKQHMVADTKDDGKLIQITRKCILTQGSNLQGVCTIPGVDLVLTHSTNIWHMFQVFGIDAAQESIYQGLLEALDITEGHPASQHVKIIAATMCFSGFPSPMTYSGMTSRDPESWLQRALFERSLETFRGASIAAHRNNMRGVSPRIMVGAPVPLGTGGDFEVVSTDEREREELSTTTRDQQRAAERWLAQGVVPLGRFYCPKPRIDDFLKTLATTDGERFVFPLGQPIPQKETRKRTRLVESTQEDGEIVEAIYLSRDNGFATFIPSSPKIARRTNIGFFTNNFRPSSP